MQIEIKQLIIPPGNVLQLKDISWQMFEQILEDLGESRAARVSYSKGFLEIIIPLLEHEFDKGFIGDFVKILLEELDIDFIDSGSTTFKNENMAQGVEPDASFYIHNEVAIRGKKKIDLTVDPPPDLAIEIDITSRTAFNNSEALGVPELWRYNGQRLQINVLLDGKYIESENSIIFSQFFQLRAVIHQYVEESKVVGRNAIMKAFRNWVREQV